MRKSNAWALRPVALLGLIAVVALAVSDVTEKSFHGYLDVRAALLVFIAPIFLQMLFQRESMKVGALFRRHRELGALTVEALREELGRTTQAARSQYGFSQVLKMSEGHQDSFVRYAGEVFSARFSPEESGRLLSQRIQAEDHRWQVAVATTGFLAKMAPYFGMLATVVGMIKLLENMGDFTRISGSMALAMQGTLYGLISFTLLYSPLQRFLQASREQAFRRNEMVARWFLQVQSGADAAYISQELRTLDLSTDLAQASHAGKSAAAQQAGSAG